MSATDKKKCKYRLPCGWCDKLDKKCSEDRELTDYTVGDFDIPLTQGADKYSALPPNYIDNNDSIIKTITPNDVALTNATPDNCIHNWCCTGVDTLGANYTCLICGKAKREDFNIDDVSYTAHTITNSTNDNEL